VLYGLVAQLFSSCTMPENLSTTILTLLALNNKAHIQYDLCEYAQSDDCVKQISKIMGSVHELHLALSSKDVEGLMCNAMLLITPTAAHAA
jgi:hypothetical protein